MNFTIRFITILFFFFNCSTTPQAYSVIERSYKNETLDLAEQLLVEFSPLINSTINNNIASNLSIFNYSTEEMLQGFKEGKYGFFCGGIAKALSKIYQSYGIECFIYDMTVTNLVTHVAILVKSDNLHFVFDPTFRLMIKDTNSGHIPIEDFTKLSFSEKKNSIFEMPMPSRKWLFENFADFNQTNKSFYNIALDGAQVFFFSETNTLLEAFRPNFRLETYLYSVSPHLREAGLSTKVSTYFNLYQNPTSIVYVPPDFNNQL